MNNHTQTMKTFLNAIKRFLDDVLPPIPVRGSIELRGVGVSSDLGPGGKTTWSWRPQAIDELVKIQDRQTRRMRVYDRDWTPQAHETMLNQYRMGLESMSDEELFDLLIEETKAASYDDGQAAERGYV